MQRQSRRFTCSVLLVVTLVRTARSFQAIVCAPRARTPTQRFLSSDGAPKRKRRKRKVVVATPEEANVSATTPEPSAEPIALQPRDRTGVSMRVQNIMASPTSTEIADATPRATKPTYIPSGESEVQDLVSNYATTSDVNDPLARMLQDARAMEDGSNNNEEGEATGIAAKIQNVISTIVTVDFFVVCALLVWFLVGIAASYLAKDDTIQIAFNNIFEPVVQPALGVLMIASISDAVLKPKEDDEIKL